MSDVTIVGLALAVFLSFCAAVVGHERPKASWILFALAAIVAVRAVTVGG